MPKVGKNQVVPSIYDILEYGLHQPVTLVLQKKMHAITGSRA